MSIRDAIASAVKKGDLQSLPHMLPGVSAVRHVFVTSEVWEFVGGPAMPKHLAHKAAGARRMLDGFTAGNRIVVSMDPHKKPDYCQLSKNAPQSSGIWEFRIRGKKPQVRIFGAFAECDVFIALSVRDRDELEGNFPLAVAENSGTWSSIFREFDPIVGDEINEYLSGSFSFS